MKPEMEGKVKFGVWGLVIGAAVTMIVGFAWGGWTTSGTTEKMNSAAVKDNQAQICIAQFMDEPNHEEKLKELEELDSWKRAKFIEAGGWDKMPGQERADYGVAQKCVEGLRSNNNK